MTDSKQKARNQYSENLDETGWGPLTVDEYNRGNINFSKGMLEEALVEGYGAQFSDFQEEQDGRVVLVQSKKVRSDGVIEVRVAPPCKVDGDNE